MHDAAQFADRRVDLEQGLRRDAPDAQDQCWIHQLDLSIQIRDAGPHFFGFRIAVAGRSRFQNVRDEHLFPRKPNGLEHGIEQLAGAPDERLALAVFIRTGRFPDDHPAGSAVTHPEHTIGAGGVQWAFRARAHCGCKRFPIERRNARGVGKIELRLDRRRHLNSPGLDRRDCRRCDRFRLRNRRARTTVSTFPNVDFESLQIGQAAGIHAERCTERWLWRKLTGSRPTRPSAIVRGFQAPASCALLCATPSTAARRLHRVRTG